MTSNNGGRQPDRLDRIEAMLERLAEQGAAQQERLDTITAVMQQDTQRFANIDQRFRSMQDTLDRLVLSTAQLRETATQLTESTTQLRETAQAHERRLQALEARQP